MPRPIWKGHITFGLVNVPVVLYSGESRDELHFNLLDSDNHARVRYQRVNEVTGEEVPWDRIVKGYELEDGTWVLLDDEDFRRADVEATRAVEIEDFVERDAVEHVYYDKPYYLAPDRGGEKGYVLLRETLRRTGRLGIARVVIRTRQYLAALLPEGDALVLDLLRFQQELRDPAELELPDRDLKAHKISERELDMAERLVESMSGPWQPARYRDEYRDALMKWIRKKAEQGGVTPPAPEQEEAPAAAGEVIDMMDLLQRSLEQRGGRKVAAARKASTRKRTGRPAAKAARKKAGGKAAGERGKKKRRASGE